MRRTKCTIFFSQMPTTRVAQMMQTYQHGISSDRPSACTPFIEKDFRPKNINKDQSNLKNMNIFVQSLGVQKDGVLFGFHRCPAIFYT